MLTPSSILLINAMAAAIYAHSQATVFGQPVNSAAFETPVSATHLAYYYAGQLVEANEVSAVFNLLIQARLADAVEGKDSGVLTDAAPEIIEEFGRGLIAEALHAPGGWFEKHERFPLVLPGLRIPPLDELVAA